MKKVVDYLEKTKQSILSTELMIELLEKRIKLASENVLIETEYNANELRILILKTESEIITLKGQQMLFNLPTQTTMLLCLTTPMMMAQTQKT